MEKVLSDIVAKKERRLKDSGPTLGECVPKSRTAPTHPFPLGDGVIMEIKRASPSAGAIDKALNIVDKTRSYIDAGASGVSVLTERDYFLGSLGDLMTVRKVIDDLKCNTPLLRKDFILDPREIEITYLAGADAVLLIGRVLSLETLTSCVAECKKFNLTAFIEVHEESDLEKVQKVLSSNPTARIALGVNSRDLNTFSIDPLFPAIRNITNFSLPSVYESGIKTPAAALFARSLGYTNILVGEGVVRDKSLSAALNEVYKRPRDKKIGDFWHHYGKKLNDKGAPLLKICGITKKEDALTASLCGADLLGFILSKGFPRTVDPAFIKDTVAAVKNATKDSGPAPLFIGVVTDEEGVTLGERLIKDGVLSALQYHNLLPPNLLDAPDIPILPSVRLKAPSDLKKIPPLISGGYPRVLIDGGCGTGESVAEDLIIKASNLTPLCLAGGVTADNAKILIDKYHLELLDCSSGVECSPGVKDKEKVARLAKLIKNIY